MAAVQVPVVRGADGMRRCAWCAGAADYARYHDEEWGRPVADDVRLFEKIALEGFQSGLSWLTILRKRAAFRRAFAGFDFVAVARFTERHVERLLGDAGIVRHRGKIEATIQNARAAITLGEECGSLGAFVWRFEPPRRARGIVTTSAESVALSKELKRRGWRFVGPTTMYAFMQSMGLVNDHAPGCAMRAPAERARKAFRSPAR